MKTLIIGGVAGGASAAARLRRLKEDEEIILLERGEYVSFANCGLPYYIGGVITERSRLTIQTPQSFKARFNVDVRVLNEAVSVNPQFKTVEIRNLKTGEIYSESYDNLILSPGARQVKPNIEGADAPNVFTLRNIPDMLEIKRYIENERPRRAVVAGGGYIGLEMAENLKRAGIETTVAEISEHLIPSLDSDMAANVHVHIRERGIDLRLNNGIKAIIPGRALLEDGELETDMVIICAGVRPDTQFLEGCLPLNERGCILTDSHMRTGVPGIYAVGDAAGIKNYLTGEPAFIPLAGPANKQGRIAADNIAGIPSEYKGTQGSSIIKLFDLTAASSGLNEKTAAGLGLDYDKTYIYSASHASYYPGGANMCIKALWDKKTLKLLGAQIVGTDGVDKRMDVLAAAIRLGARITDLAQLELCYAPPFSSAKDPVNMLGFVAENVINKKVKQFFWHDVEKLPRDGSVTLLDVRTRAEVSRGHIDGFKNIPLDSLRERMDEIPGNRPVYVHCHSGLRSYIACRILAGRGYDCYNLAGGWQLYERVINERKVPEYICTQCR